MAQTPAVRTHSYGDYIDHTPVGAVTAGDVVVVGNNVFIATDDIAAGELGAIAAEGVFDVPKTSDTFSNGDPVYWNASGTPVTGTASSGAADNATGKLMGWATADAVTGASYVRTKLKQAALVGNATGTVTAIAGGATTGLIPVGSRFVTVTSSDANFQISLPAGSVGDVLRILVGTTGCELISAVAADKVNEVVVGATNELALTAEALYTCVYTKPGYWIVTGVTKLGAAQAALVPDAL